MEDNKERLYYENILWEQDKEYVAGIDEAGRGPLAGPVVAASVIFEPNCNIIDKINDSKSLQEEDRENLYEIIHDEALSVGIGTVGSKEIDASNILQSTYKAMRKSVGQLDYDPDFLLIDGRGLPDQIYRNKGIKQGDKKCYSISAASIIAKVYRDNLMKKYSHIFPDFDFNSHKGYGTKNHRNKIEENFPTPIHRQSFKGVKEHYQKLLNTNNTRAIGKYGEHLAALHLYNKDYQIVERNYHCSTYGELDIIAQKGGTICFVEVKSHRKKGPEPPETSVDRKKMEQLGKIADAYLYENPYSDYNCRFDVISVIFNQYQEKVKHYKNAFIL